MNNFRSIAKFAREKRKQVFCICCYLTRGLHESREY